MRHQLSGRQLSRNAPHRSAMFRNMATSLLRHETIRTTLPKAKELRRVVEPLITLGKVDTDSNRRRAFAQLRDADVVVKLFESLSPRFMTRPGGYTRILRMDPRPGDAAPMALVQLLDQPEAVVEAEETGDDAAAKAPKKKAAARKTSPRKRAVKTDEQRAEKKAKNEAKAASDVKKAEVKATAKASKKTAPKKKASAKKKSGK